MGSGTAGGVSSAALTLLREVASLALEGRPRSAPGPVRAPVPPHAAPALDRLFARGRPGSLDDFQKDLAETHAHPPELTPSLRAAQLGIQAAVLGPGLAVMFVVPAVTALVLAGMAVDRAAEAAKARAAVPPSDRRAADRLERARAEVVADGEARRAALLAPQRLAFEAFEATAPGEAEVAGWAAWATAPDGSREDRAGPPGNYNAFGVRVTYIGAAVLVPFLWAVGAVVLRGGVSMRLTGVAVVRANGRRAGRWRCGLRATVVWLPVAGLLAASAWLQTDYYRHAYLYTVAWLGAVALLPVCVVVALKDPARPPQDRLAGTYLVPE